MAANGTLELDGETFDVDGIAWFDHQWGDFVSVGGGWDWFAINLDDGTDITVSVVFGPEGQGRCPVRDRRRARMDGPPPSPTTTSAVRATESWTSPTTGRL